MSRALLRSGNQSMSLASPGMTAQFSAAVWLKTTNLTDTQILMGFRDVAGNRGGYLVLRGADPGDKLGAVMIGHGGTGEAQSTGAVQSGVWQLAGAVYTSNVLRAVYLGSAKDTNTTNTGGDPAVDTLYLGRIEGGAYFDGELAAATVWNTALTDADFAALAAGVSVKKIRPQSILDHWPLAGEGGAGTNERGIKGLVLTNANTTHGDSYPPIYR